LESEVEVDDDDKEEDEEEEDAEEEEEEEGVSKRQLSFGLLFSASCDRTNKERVGCEVLVSELEEEEEEEVEEVGLTRLSES
jgi:hypothetical protein